jgi:hypothetical protein
MAAATPATQHSFVVEMDDSTARCRCGLGLLDIDVWTDEGLDAVLGNCPEQRDPQAECQHLISSPTRRGAWRTVSCLYCGQQPLF